MKESDRTGLMRKGGRRGRSQGSSRRKSKSERNRSDRRAWRYKDSRNRSHNTPNNAVAGATLHPARPSLIPPPPFRHPTSSPPWPLNPPSTHTHRNSHPLNKANPNSHQPNTSSHHRPVKTLQLN